jgi:hypothetical protein
MIYYNSKQKNKQIYERLAGVNIRRSPYPRISFLKLRRLVVPKLYATQKVLFLFQLNQPKAAEMNICELQPVIKIIRRNLV